MTRSTPLLAAPARRTLALGLAALALLAAGCSSEKTCASDQVLCSNACVSLPSDAANCGACGNTCGAAQGCFEGACVDCGESGAGCRAAVVAACFNTNELRAFDAGLVAVGAPLATAAGPGSFARLGGTLYVGTVLGGTIARVTPPTATDVVSIPGGGGFNDLEYLGARGSLLYASNAATGTLVAADPARAAVVGEVPLSVNGVVPSVLGIGFARDKAFVALTPAFGQTTPAGVAVVDLSAAPPWTAPPAVTFLDVAGFASAGTQPGAARVLPSADGARVFVTLNNLFDASFTPAAGANGRLVVVDAATGQVTGTPLDLGPACRNPSGMALSGATLWIGCGYTEFDFSTGAGVAVGGGLLPVDVSGAQPVAGPVVPTPQAVGSIAICGGQGYAGASGSGALMKFDPAASGLVATNPAACPASSTGFSSIFDVACAP